MEKSTESSAKYNLIPPKDDKEVGPKIFIILDEILEDKDQLGLPGKWAYHYELGKNKHWKEGSKKASLVSVNLLHTHRQRTVNMLTDNNPTFNVAQIGKIPNEESLNAFLHIAQHWWQDQNQQHVLEKSIINGETFGCTVEKVAFNPDLEYGMGEVETNVIPPHYFGLYPVKVMEVQKAEAVLYYRPMSIREVRRKYPDKADKIEADSSYLSRLGVDDLREVISGKPGKVQGWLASIGNVVKHMMGNTEGDAGKSDQDEVLIVECYVKDYTKTTGNGETKPKYPGEIRYIVTCNCGELILEDRGNPSINPNLSDDDARVTYLFDKFPFSRTHSLTDTINPWGMTDFEQLKFLNIEMNKCLSQFNLFKDKAARLKLLNPKNSGVPNEQLDNYPRTIRPANHLVAQGIRYLDPPKNPVDIQNALGIYRELFFLVAGTFDLELAKSPGRDVIAYKSIAALLERATTMMRGKVRNYSMMTTERGSMYFSCAQNWYTDERFIPYDENGEKKTLQITAEKIRFPVKLTVVPGSTMPISQIQRREEAIGLAKDNRIDNEELLKRLDWPDYRGVLKRMLEGPFSGFLNTMSQLGTPPPLIQYFQQIFNTDPKDIEKAVKDEKIPPFPVLLQMLMQQGQPQQEDPMKTAAVQETQSKVQKTIAETRLIEEKIITERVLQIVKTTGVELDKEQLKIERAKVVNEIKKGIMDQQDGLANKRGQGPYRERGFSSNNEQITGE